MMQWESETPGRERAGRFETQGRVIDTIIVPLRNALCNLLALLGYGVFGLLVVYLLVGG